MSLKGGSCQGGAHRMVSYQQCLDFERTEGRKEGREKGGRKETQIGYSVLRTFYMRISQNFVREYCNTLVH